jgi:predicted ATPase
MVAGYQLIDRAIPTAGTVICRARRSQDDAKVWLVWPASSPESSVAPRGAAIRRRFELLRSLGIPGIATPSDLLDGGGDLVMEVAGCQGVTLAERLRQRPLALRETLEIAHRLTGILAELHARGLVAGCIHPSQLVFDPDPVQLCWLASDLAAAPKLADLAQLPTEELGCISPEQTGRISRPVDYRSDFYSFGILLYFLLTGHLPFAANDPLGWVHCHLARLPRPPDEVVPTLPSMLSRLVMKLMAKAADDRYQSARGLQLDLEECMAQFSASGHIVPFPLARHDVSERFQIPHKLYGREAEVGLLRQAFFDMAESGSTSVLLVAGYSGIGKTSLVQALRRPAAERHALFATGKFDQYRRDIPYATISEALRDLVRQVLAETEASLAVWRQSLREALGGNAKLVFELIPELTLAVGPPPDLPELPPGVAENRFHRVFRRFISVFARPERPLVLFLDDLQWLDVGTGKLLEELILHPETRHLLLVGAYRDNEIEASEASAPPLATLLTQLEKAGAKIRTIKLGPLDASPLERLVAATLHVDRQRAAPLAQLVLRKSGGNPFFFNHFLGDLHDSGLLTFDAEQRAWHWDLERIDRKPHTDNVVELMLAKLGRLPEATARHLQLAACLGTSFEIEPLALLAERPAEEITAELQRAAAEGLVEYHNGRWRFSQDRVQEVACSQFPAANRPELHLRVGRHLLTKLAPGALAEQVFDVVDHLNRGLALLADDAERRRLAQLNALAGRKAKAAVAYLPARDYFTQSLALLPSTAWTDAYADTFSLRLELAECEYLAGNFSAAQEQFEVALAHAVSDLDRARVLRLESRLYQTQGRFTAAMSLLLQALRLFGVVLPDAAPEIAHATESEIAAISGRVRGRPISELAAAPAATDATGIAVISLLVEAFGPAYAAKARYFPLLAAKAVTCSLRFGNIPESAIAYGAYAIVLVAQPQTTQAAFEFSEMALALLERFDDPRPRGLVLIGHGGMICPWLKHIEAGLPYVERGLAELVEAGDFLNAGYSSMFPVWGAFEAGMPLDQVVATAERYAGLAREVHHGMAHDTLRLCQQLLTSLGEETALPSRPITGPASHPASDSTAAAQLELARLDGRTLDAAQCMSDFARANWDLGIAYYKVMQQMTAFLGSHYVEAAAAGKEAWTVLRYRRPMPLATTVRFFETLTWVALYPEGSPTEQAELAGGMARNLEKFSRWAEHGRESFRHRLALLAAEVARIGGRDAEAMRAYEEAIAAAREHRFVQYEGLAYELASRFYRARGFTTFADFYSSRARHCYTRWGALAKVHQLEVEYPQLLHAESPLSLTVTSESARAVDSAGQLDTMALIKTMRAISGEVVFERLVDTLMRVVMESTGAQKAALMLKRAEIFPVVASASVVGQELRVSTETETDSKRADLPSSVINYVRRSGEKVLLDDAVTPTPIRTSCGHGPNRFSVCRSCSRRR